MAETRLVRLFLAVWPPPGVVTQIDSALPRGGGDLRWQSPDRWHITLAFLGQRNAEQEMARLDRFGVPAAHELRVRGSGTFGPVLWLGVDHGPWLNDLAADIRQRFRVDERRFTAHITVARARNESGRRELKRAAAELSEAASEAWLPREITLVQSTTGPHPRYEVIGRRAFEGP